MEKKKETEKRESFLDSLRVSATLAVVLLHTVTGIMDATDMSGYPLEKKAFLIILDLVTWCVPVFVLISGYLFLNPEREISFGQMLKKYCRRIVLALFLFGVPFACLELVAGEGTFRLQMLWQAVVMVCTGRSWSHLWYLYMILFLYLITPLLKRLLKKTPPRMLYGVLAFLLAGSSLAPFLRKLLEWERLPVLPDGGIYLFYYLCGYLFAAKRRTQEKPALRAAAAAGLVVLAAGMTASRLTEGYRVQMAYNYPFTVMAALLLMWLLRERKGLIRGKSRAFLGKLSPLCFAVYLVHPVFVNIYYKFLHITPLNFPGALLGTGGSPGVGAGIWVSLPLFFLLVLLPAVTVAWILYKIPLLRKYIL